MKRLSECTGPMCGPEDGPPDGMPWTIVSALAWPDYGVRCGDRWIYRTDLRAYHCERTDMVVWPFVAQMRYGCEFMPVGWLKEAS